MSLLEKLLADNNSILSESIYVKRLVRIEV